MQRPKATEQRSTWRPFWIALSCVCGWVLIPGTVGLRAQSAKVFILAGQSNMEGKADNALLERQALDPRTADQFAHLRQDGKWAVRQDVFIKFLDRRGPLTIGFGSPGKTGPELEFGWVLGDHFQEPVVLIKAAWGGHSLGKNFRPPSAGWPAESVLQKEWEQRQKQVRENNEKHHRQDPLPTLEEIRAPYGESYREILKEVATVQQHAEQLFPELQGTPLEIAGFVWFQGWNDQYGGQDEYAQNLEWLIRDLRRDLQQPALPVVIAAMGQNGSQPAEGPLLTIRTAQLAMNDRPEFQNNVRAFRTDVLVDRSAESLYPEWKERKAEWDQVGSDHPYHYLGSAIWFNRIGRAMGEAMLELLH